SAPPMGPKALGAGGARRYPPRMRPSLSAALVLALACGPSARAAVDVGTPAESAGGRAPAAPAVIGGVSVLPPTLPAPVRPPAGLAPAPVPGPPMAAEAPVPGAALPA